MANYIYDGNDKLKYIIISEGRLVFNGNAPTFEYNTTDLSDVMLMKSDHLGNVRVVFNHSGQTLQENSYYSFGLIQPVCRQAENY